MRLLRAGELVSAPETAGGRIGGVCLKPHVHGGFSEIAENSENIHRHVPYARGRYSKSTRLRRNWLRLAPSMNEDERATET